MSVLALDSFDWNGNTIINNRYSSVSTTPTFSNTQTKHGSGYALFCGDTNDFVRYDIGDQSGNVIICGFYIYFDSIYNTLDTTILYFYNADSNQQCKLVIDKTTNVLKIIGAPSAVGTQQIQLDTWYHIELKIKITNSTASGECVLKIDGVEDINETGIDTQAYSTNSLQYVSIGTNSSGSDIYFDDFYVLDTNGTYANDFIGPHIRIECLEPDGNGNSNDFVGSDANSVDNYLHVDEVPADDDTSYVESSTVGHKDGYTFDNLAGSINSIMAVQTMTRHKKDESGARTTKHFIRRSAADYDGSSIHTLSADTYENDVEIWIEDPSTSAQWAETNVNAMEAGIKVQA